MADKTLVCKDCGKEFIFSESEQAFYKEKGFDNEPQRCAECRKAKKLQNNNRQKNTKQNNNNRSFKKY
jgi:hypothetical protein